MSETQVYLVSLLKEMYDTFPQIVSLEDIYRMIILETLKSDTEKHRYYLSTGQKNEARRIKNKMANFTPSVLLSEGKAEENITGYTGMGMADFDHVPSGDLQRCFALLAADPYVLLAYVTISGEGMRVVYCTDVTEARYHEQVFAQGNDYYSRLLGYPFDRQCKNVARTSILCHCPQAVFHPEAEAMVIELSRPARRRAPSKRDVGEVVVSDVGVVTAEEAASEVSSRLLEEGKMYVEGHYNEYVSAALFLMNRYGVGEGDALRWAVARFSDYDAAMLESIVRSVYLHTEEHATWRLASTENKQGRYASLVEVEDFITSQLKIRNNVITDRREVWFTGEAGFRDITDRDENSLWIRAVKKGIRTGPGIVQIVLNSEYAENFNPLVSYLEGLDPWDGKVDYIRRLTDTVHTHDNELFYHYFRKWFVGLIASIVNPEVVNHEVLVFVGGQGQYKTTWMNRLMPPEWRRYFFTKTNSNHMTKDDHLTLAEFALICFEEIDNMRPSEMNQLKAMITSPAVIERASYAHNKAYRPHIASFCGTGNNIAFLNDPTGTRRWLPFEVESIDDPYGTVLPYREIYAQGLALYRSGFRYWFDRKEIDVLNERNERFEVPAIESDLVQMYYRKPTLGEHGIFVSTAEIMQRINAQIKAPLSVMALAAAMRKLGFQSCRSHNVRGYRLVELSSMEIDQRKHDMDGPQDASLPFCS